jgi:hypothetical protein
MQKTHAFKRRVIHFADEAFKPVGIKIEAMKEKACQKAKRFSVAVKKRV